MAVPDVPESLTDQQMTDNPIAVPDLPGVEEVPDDGLVSMSVVVPQPLAVTILQKGRAAPLKSLRKAQSQPVLPRERSFTAPAAAPKPSIITRGVDLPQQRVVLPKAAAAATHLAEVQCAHHVD
eukprot:TRINITY_DN3622_c0_g3_i1.p1 TRINITY_DN3622_c0_g3~~TRINITY_DN3622_c0_g3_i1.p1  ORF type:complete len:143 (+),score=29.95 TRINITY_DN3622_c0_g3_i1:60-431(+)